MTSQFQVKMIYKIRMGDLIEINLIPLGFSFKELSNQTKN